MNILLIEDDPLDIFNFQHNIQKKQLNVHLTIANNGQEALDLLQDNEYLLFPDIILLDLNMPKMNGYEFLRHLRNDPRLKRIKVFVITSSTDKAERERLQQFDINGYIVKPLDFSNFNSSKDTLNLLIDIMNA
jgi:CheY-like chemotaxis protein